MSSKCFTYIQFFKSEIFRQMSTLVIPTQKEKRVVGKLIFNVHKYKTHWSKRDELEKKAICHRYTRTAVFLSLSLDNQTTISLESSEWTEVMKVLV